MPGRAEGHIDRPASVQLALALDDCHTRLATGDEAHWVMTRLAEACAALGTVVEKRDERLVAVIE